MPMESTSTRSRDWRSRPTVPGATEVVGAVIGAVTSSVLSITSTMWLRVELRAFEMIMGFTL